MLKKHEHYAKDLDDALKCYYSESGCYKIPVRTVGCLTGEVNQGKPIVDAVMLCRDHAATFQPTGKVLFDKVLANPATLEFLTSHGI